MRDDSWKGEHLIRSTPRERKIPLTVQEERNAERRKKRRKTAVTVAEPIEPRKGKGGARSWANFNFGGSYGGIK